MDLGLTNEHIAVAQMSLLFWFEYVKSLKFKGLINQATRALCDLEAMSVERRLLIELNVAAEYDPELTINVDDLACILLAINHVMQLHFLDDAQAPVYIRQVRQHFFDLICRQQGNSRLATALLAAPLDLGKKP
jgi:hypothetical protein